MFIFQGLDKLLVLSGTGHLCSVNYDTKRAAFLTEQRILVSSLPQMVDQPSHRIIVDPTYASSIDSYIELCICMYIMCE